MPSESDKLNIESDKPLEVARRYLLVTALVLLALTSAKAELSKVNGLIFELTFDAPERLTVLLAIGVVFLMLRYYSHASKYHQQTFETWSEKFMRDTLMIRCCEHSDQMSGLLIELGPKNLDLNELLQDNNGSFIDWKLQRNFIFNSSIIYDQINRGHPIPDFEVSILELWKDRKRDYFKVLRCMFKHWLAEVIHSPGVLYLYSPYLIGIAALVSFILRAVTA